VKFSTFFLTFCTDIRGFAHELTHASWLSLSKFLVRQKQVIIIVGQVQRSACPFARLFYENIFKGLEFVDLKFFKTIRILGYGGKPLYIFFKRG